MIKFLELMECEQVNMLDIKLWGRLGILLQRGNAAILANRVPDLPAANIDGIL